MKYEFTYVDFIPKDATASTRFLGLFQWGCRGIGFGEVTLTTEGIDSEGMSTEFLVEMFRFYVKNNQSGMEQSGSSVGP